jgi:3-oxoacyl-[acyl-carrier protein] reductase/pteridine reductase
MEIKGKTALVTGGAHRVGKAIALELARAGANLVINYHSSAAAAEETVKEVQALGVAGLAFQADVADLDQVRATAATARERFGGVDILVNSASIWKMTPLPITDYTDWHRVTSVLIDGPMYCAGAVVPMMRQRGEGAIVNIVDLSVWYPWPGYAAHCVGKSALLAITRQLALELAPEIQVNAVAPGPVLPPPGTSPERLALIADRTLKGHWGSARDVAGAVRFLVEADYITGEVIAVDGGERYGHKKPAAR